MLMQDQKAANKYWADKEYKSWVVQVSVHRDAATVYVRARTKELALKTGIANCRLTGVPRGVVRLATARDLGCTLRG